MFRKQFSILLLFTMVAMLMQSAIHHIVDDHEDAETCDYCLVTEQMQPVDLIPAVASDLDTALHAVYFYEEQLEYFAFAKASPLKDHSSIRPPPPCS